MICVQAFTMMAFGGCHLLAWNFHFPTRIEWNLASIACIILPICFQVLITFDNGSWPRRIITGMYVFLGVMMLFARSFLLVEIFASLRSVPESVYESVYWQQYIPHL